jgi:putative transposase
MVRDGLISDDFWDAVAPELPARGARGRPWADHRRMLEGISWRYRTGSPWRDLPTEFGPWQTVWKRHFRWSTDGTYQRILAAVTAAGLVDTAAQAGLQELLSVDSTVVRAHQHAAGARAATPTGGTLELHGSAGRAS